jgi:lysophospholipase L1-like esterase
MTIPVLAVLLIVTLVFLTISRLAVERIEHNHHQQRVDFFKRYPVYQNDIVFLGDSITDGGCWEELFPGIPLKNRGINADTTTGVLNRMDDILVNQPKAIFILIGTNDLPFFQYRHDDDILNTYTEILTRCKTKSPSTRVFVQSLLPRHKRYAKRIRGLNSRLQELARQFDYTFIDLYSTFAGEHGELKKELTNDNLHLMAEGYARWVKILQPYIDSLVSQSK